MMSSTGSVLPSPQSMVAVKFSSVSPGALSRPGSVKGAGSRTIKPPAGVCWLGRGAGWGVGEEKHQGGEQTSKYQIVSVGTAAG